MNIFVYLLFGHIIGDFFLQPKSMAVKKGASNRIAFAHVFIYTGAVFLFTVYFLPNLNPLEKIVGGLSWYLIIFIPHFLIDRFSLADKWLKFINGRSLEDFFENGHKDIPIDKLSVADKWENYHILRGGFTTIVYVMVDNTSHLICLWYGFKLLTKIFGGI